MAQARQHHEDRARRTAVALASFLRAQAGLPLEAVGRDAECLALISEVLAEARKPAQRLRRQAGRRRVHNREWARSCLLDYVVAHPDGMQHQAALIRELERRFEASGRQIPAETWLKQTVRLFQAEVDAFEMDAIAAFTASPILQSVFGDAGDFLRFRRSKSRASQIWADDPKLRAQFASPEELLEAIFHNGSTPAGGLAISAYSGLAHDTTTAHPVRRERSSS